MRYERSLEADLAARCPGLRVEACETSRGRYARTTLPSGTRPALVARPADTEQVRQLVEAANDLDVPLYPVSRGRNWGYGDACAVTAGHVVVDLGGMDRITEVHPELGYAVVEPGVTFGQLSARLAADRVPFWVDVTGGGPDTSVLGNTLERGFGHTPHADHFHQSAGYEVVLGDGRVFTTGFGHYPGAKSTYVYKPGVGPSLDGLFTQSNLGIVTRMGVWLQPKPEHLLGFLLTTPDRDAIGELVDRLRPLRQVGLLPSAVHIGNDLRLASAGARFPWDRLDGTGGLPDAVRAEYAGRHANGQAWVGLGGLYGTRRTTAAAAAELKKAVRGVARVRLFDSRKLAVMKQLLGLAGRVGLGRRQAEAVARLDRSFDLLRGVASADHLRGAGWRSRADRHPGSTDPLANGWGLIWVAPLVPLTGADVSAALAVQDRVSVEYGFEPMATVTLLTGRAVLMVLNVSFDKTNRAEADRAGRCAAALTDALAARGYHPYRCGTWAMSRLADADDPFWGVVGTLKSALDPNRVLAPGRYEAGPPAPASHPVPLASGAGGRS